MSTLTKQTDINVIYPESDGKPMAENTKQYEWIVTIKENLDALLTDAFVAADLFWYPVEGNAKTVQAPDVLVAKGRPKGHRPSYKQWQEDNIAPQVVFEIISPGNTWPELARKLEFYNRHGVSEYYIYDPDHDDLLCYIREQSHLQLISDNTNWQSPLMGIRFEITSDGLNIYLPNGQRFVTFQELIIRANEATQRADEATQRADEAAQRAEKERQEKEAALEKLAALNEKLRQLGINPDA